MNTTENALGASVQPVVSLPTLRQTIQATTYRAGHNEDDDLL